MLYIILFLKNKHKKADVDMVFETFLKIPPIGKARPRFVRKNGVSFTPRKTRLTEAAIKYFLAEKKAVMFPEDVPLSVSLIFQYHRPKSVKKSQHWKLTKPDLDNSIKLLDAAEGILFRNDNQIVEIHAQKLYDDEEGIFIHIETIED